jgi:hypothetical protein
LEDKDGLILEMDDFELPAVWKFKYRYCTAIPNPEFLMISNLGCILSCPPDTKKEMFT